MSIRGLKPSSWVVLCGAMLMASCSMPPSREAERPSGRAVAEPASLAPVESFAGIPGRSERSVALFTEAARVLLHPRCANCHPRERSPTQGDDMHPHQPPIQATDTGHGVPTLQCNTCHQSATFDTQATSVRSIPGHPHWALAPASMAWQGASLRQICEQLKDASRNGGRSLQAVHEHVADDTLVGWAWHPGNGRTPAPGTQRATGELIAAWIETGAVCPSS